MAGLVPAIHVFLPDDYIRGMPGLVPGKPRMTVVVLTRTVLLAAIAYSDAEYSG
jgi:hypothetical protein